MGQVLDENRKDIQRQWRLYTGLHQGKLLTGYEMLGAISLSLHILSSVRKEVWSPSYFFHILLFSVSPSLHLSIDYALKISILVSPRSIHSCLPSSTSGHITFSLVQCVVFVFVLDPRSVSLLADSIMQ